MEQLLLPHHFKRIGWLILIPATIMGIILTAYNYELSLLDMQVFAIYIDDFFGEKGAFSWVTVDATNTIVGILFILGGLMVGFSQVKNEDEYIAGLRLSALLWAVWAHYGLLFLAFLFIWGLPFMTVMVYNMFTVLIIFIIRFHYLLFKSNSSLAYEQ